MLQSEIDTFFMNHPLKERFFAFSAEERAGCAAVAERDVLAAVADCTLSGEKQQQFLNAAIAEQTVFLLLNPEYITGTYTRTAALSSGGESRKFSDVLSPLGQRAAALISPLLNGSFADAAAGENGEDAAAPGTASAVMLKLSRG